MKETQIVKAILDYLKLKKIFHWRNNSGSFITKHKDGSAGYYSFGQAGSPDIFAVIEGKIYGFEVKNEKNKQTENQTRWQNEFQNNGGIYAVVRSIDDVKKIIK